MSSDKPTLLLSPEEDVLTGEMKPGKTKETTYTFTFKPQKGLGWVFLTLF